MRNIYNTYGLYGGGQGPTGPQGPQGDTGPQGPPLVDGVTSSVELDAGTNNRIAVFDGTTGRVIKESNFDTTGNDLSFLGATGKIKMYDNTTSLIKTFLRKHHRSLNIGFENTTTSTDNDSITIGYNAGNLAEGGYNAVVIGVDACPLVNNTAFNTTAIGYQAGNLMVSGANNTFVGSMCANNFISGDTNLILGCGSATILTNGDNNIYLQSDGGSSPIESGTLRIGNPGYVNIAYIQGINGSNSGAPFCKLTSTLSDGKIEDSAIFARVDGANSILSQTISGLPSQAVGVDFLTNFGLNNLLVATTATVNTLYGNGILSAATTLANSNCCYGTNILFSALANTSNNCCFGNNIGITASNGNQQNCVFGNNSAQNMNGCVRCISIGQSTASGLTNNQRCIYIDSNGTNGESNVIRIGEHAIHTNLFLAGVGSSMLSNHKTLITDTTTGEISAVTIMETAEVTFENYASPYTRTLTLNTPAEIQFTQTLLSNGNSSWNSATAGRLQYLGMMNTAFHCAFSFSCVLNAGTNVNVQVGVYKNGVNVTNSNIRRKLSSSTEYNMITFHKIVQLTTNDYISCFITNLSDNNSVNFGNCNMVCMAT